MKKRLLIGLLIGIMATVPVHADFDYSVFDGLSLEELKEIHTELGDRISSATSEGQAESSVANETRYDSGQYKIGIDIPAGEYVIFANTNGRNGYYFETLDPNGNEYAGSGSFVYNTIVSISDGNYLRLDNAYAVPIEENPYVDITKCGCFKAGFHIPPGEYRLIPGGDRMSSYYFVYADSYKERFAGSGRFDGNAYVSVEDGQILELTNALIEW